MKAQHPKPRITSECTGGREATDGAMITGRPDYHASSDFDEAACEAAKNRAQTRGAQFIDALMLAR